MPAIGTTELLATLSNERNGFGFDIYKEAKERRRSMSAHLDSIMEIDPKDRAMGMDGFTTLIAHADVNTRTIPDEGIYADLGSTFLDKCGRTMLIEWGWRTYRRALQDNRRSYAGQRAALESVDFQVGTSMRPWVGDTEIRMDDFQPAIPLTEVLAATRGIEGNSFRGIYLTEPTAAQKRWVRIGERSEIPKVTITMGEHNINMYKFGRGVELTYEVLRREPMDRLGTIIQLMAVQNEIDKLSVVIDVMTNGDGNSGTAATSYNLTALDTALLAGAVPSLRSWYTFRSKWKNPYQMTHILVREAASINLQLLNTGSANLPTAVIPSAFGFSPQLRPINRNLAQVVGLGETDDAPASKWLGFDRRAAVERFFEIGSDIEESAKYANNQTESVYFTEVEGYMVRSANGVKIADLAA